MEYQLELTIVKLKNYLYEHMFSGTDFLITEEILKALTRTRLTRCTDLLEELIKILSMMQRNSQHYKGVSVCSLLNQNPEILRLNSS